MGIAEPDVTLTDYGLAIECALLAAFLYRTPANAVPLRFYFVAFFCAVGLAALLGGTDHGFLLDKTTYLRAIVWKGTLLAIGLSALAAWQAGALLIAPTPARWIRAGSVVIFIGYLFAVARSDAFLVAIVHYLPAVVFLLAVFGWHYVRGRERHYLYGAVALLLTFAAAGVQQARIGLHPVLFDHNALYHLIQAVALLLLFFAARGIVRRSGEVAS
jgi:hypothetical protein